MIFDLYLQGLNRKNDGRLLLSLSGDELNRVCDHQYRGTDAVKDLTTMLIGSRLEPKSGSINSKQAEEFLGGFRKEEIKMNEYPTNTPKNPQIQPSFYLFQAIRIMDWAVGKCAEDKRGLFMHVRPETQGLVTRFKREKPTQGYCSINWASVEIANPNTQNYFGKIDWSDHIEHSGGRDPWVAHPVPDEARMKTKHPINIRPASINELTNGYNFTLLEDFDNVMRNYIYKTIEEFNG